MLICAIDFGSIARPNECAARARASQARKYWHQARTTPGTRQMVLQTAADLSHRAKAVTAAPGTRARVNELARASAQDPPAPP